MNDLVIPLNSLKNDKTLNIKNLSVNTILLKKVKAIFKKSKNNKNLSYHNYFKSLNKLSDFIKKEK